MSKHATIKVDASQYADYDDCLTAAAEDYADEHDLKGWDLEPRWGDDSRKIILLTVPAWSVADEDDDNDSDEE